MSVLKGCFLLLCLLVCVTAFTYHGTRRLSRTMRMDSSDPALRDKMQEAVEADPELKQFLAGNVAKWKGTTDSLKRRRQVPDAGYTPQQVVEKCLAALEINDEPQLDHGCCVLLSFKSPTGPLAAGGLDPAEYGRFLRGTEYSVLTEFASAQLIGGPAALPGGLSLKQSVRVTDYSRKARVFDFYLSQFDGCWLVDVVLLQKEKET